ncbi:MAG: hypothetical protein R8G01_16320 [Ilumatobacteraceae bacterium]|nr:hypothetical protein [Ilumatobacteraceae bacterium]
MKGLAVCRYDETEPSAAHPIDGHVVDGALVARMLGPADYSLWLVELSIEANAEIHLPDVHGDEALYVCSGELDVGGRSCPAGGSVVIESEAHPVVRTAVPSVVLHMGPVEPSATSRSGTAERRSSVHIVGPEGWLAAISPGRASRYYADSTCEGCDLTLLFTSRDRAYVSPTHSHSVDELIHVLEGPIRLGAHTLDAGDTLAVAADRRYGFRADDGFAFLNYRSAASVQTVERGSPPIVEGGLVNGFSPIPDGAVDIRVEG